MKVKELKKIISNQACWDYLSTAYGLQSALDLDAIPIDEITSTKQYIKEILLNVKNYVSCCSEV